MPFAVTRSDGSTRTVDAADFHLDGPMVIFTTGATRVAAYPVGEILSVDLLDLDADAKACAAERPESTLETSGCCADDPAHVRHLHGVDSFVITELPDPEISFDVDFEVDKEAVQKLMGAIFPDQLRCSVWQNVAHGPWFWEVLQQKSDGTLLAIGLLHRGTYGGGQESTKVGAKDAAQRFVEKHFDRLEREAAIAEHRAATTEVHLVDL